MTILIILFPLLFIDDETPSNVVNTTLSLVYWNSALAKSVYETNLTTSILIIQRETYENFLFSTDILKVLEKSLKKEKIIVNDTNSEYLLCLVKKCFDYIFLCSGGAL